VGSNSFHFSSSFAESFAIPNNNVFGELPSAVGDLSELISLDYRDNFFNLSLTTAIGQLTNLVDLAMDRNFQTGSLPSEIGNMESLESLRLDDNLFSDSIPVTIGNLTSLGKHEEVKDVLDSSHLL